MYFGILPPKKENRIKLIFPFKGYLYELKEGKEYGYVDSIEIETKDNIAIKLYGLIPGQINSMDVKMKPVYKKGEIINYQIEVPRSYKADVVCKVELIDPDGNINKLYSKVVVVKGTSYKGSIPLAYNDKEGNWKIRITDAVSKKQIEKIFKLQ